MQYFRTAQLYLKNIINKFHIFAISEHCLFTEQLDLLKQFLVELKSCFQLFLGNLEGILSEQLSYEEVCNICDKLKQGATGIPFSYEHITFAGPDIWFYLFKLYKRYFFQMQDV